MSLPFAFVTREQVIMPLGGGPIVLRMCVEIRIQPMAREMEIPGRNASIRKIEGDILPGENPSPRILPL